MRRKDKPNYIYLQLAAVAIGLFVLGRLAYMKVQAQAVNRLAAGDRAKAETVRLEINPQANLNFLSRQEILEKRRSYLYRHPELLMYQYVPTGAIFDSMEEQKPWWGLKGQLFFGPGNRSIEGDAEESRFLYNPFLLAQANLFLKKVSWDESFYASREDLAASAMPLDCPPQSANIYPRVKKEELAYNVSDFLRQCENASRVKTGLDALEFDLVVYNARDMGYNYLAVSNYESQNIEKTGSIVKIDQYIHCGDTCGYPGGCNNMSPYNDKLFDLGIKSLPAKAVVKLWQNYPRSANDAGDFEVTLLFN